MKTDRMEQSRMIFERALKRSSNLFNCNGVPMGMGDEHELSVAYVANLFVIAAALYEQSLRETGV